LATLPDKQPTAPVTDLAAALLSGLEEERPQGQAVLLLSDGIHNAGDAARVLDAARVARALACPVYTWTTGSDAEVKDVAVELPAPQELAFVGQKIVVPVTLRQRGLAGREVTLTLSREGKELERRSVPLPAEGTAEIRVEVSQDQPGLYRYDVRAEPLPEEVTRANNTSVLLLRVIDKPVRVLLLEGKPYWDAKFLVRTLLADASVDLDSVVRLGDDRLMWRTVARETGGGPSAKVRDSWKVLSDLAGLSGDAEALRSYQILVLGRDADAFLTESMLTALQTWVARDGGCLVCYRGPPTSPVSQRLGKMLPIQWAAGREERFRMRVTERGQSLHLFPGAVSSGGEALGQLPTLAAAARPGVPKPLAVILASRSPSTGDEEPAVSYQPYGGGRVVVVEGAGM
jgi:hypothetical protein